MTLDREYMALIEDVLLPAAVMVFVSCIAMFIKITSLPPRVTIGFVTFLTLANWEASLSRKFVSQDHPVWFTEFFKLCRLTVAASLFQTGTSYVLSEKVSGRLSREFDRISRPIFAANFLICLICFLSADKRAPGSVEALSYLSYIDIGLLIVVLAALARWLHHKLRHALIYDPLRVFHDDPVALDVNDALALYASFDSNGDEQVSVDEIARSFMISMEGNGVQLTEQQKDELIDLLRQRIPTNILSREAFRQHHRAIFNEALSWKIALTWNSSSKRASAAAKRWSAATFKMFRKRKVSSTDVDESAVSPTHAVSPDSTARMRCASPAPTEVELWRPPPTEP